MQGEVCAKTTRDRRDLRTGRREQVQRAAGNDVARHRCRASDGRSRHRERSLDGKSAGGDREDARSRLQFHGGIAIDRNRIGPEANGACVERERSRRGDGTRPGHCPVRTVVEEDVLSGKGHAAAGAGIHSANLTRMELEIFEGRGADGSRAVDIHRGIAEERELLRGQEALQCRSGQHQSAIVGLE